jgi:hypothetical protein
MLLLSATDAANNATHLRFARLGLGRKVTATGLIALGDLPTGMARLAFYTRSAYFSQTETERRPAKILAIQARRLIDAELAFNEPQACDSSTWRRASKSCLGCRSRSRVHAVGKPLAACHAAI